MKYIWNRKKGQRGFTLIELVVVLAILGILIALAVPRYLGARRGALIAEGDNTLQELKTLGWAYYLQYGTWAGVTAANVVATFGFTPPGQGCWTYDLSDLGSAASLQLRATSGAAGARAVCGALPAGTSIMLSLSNDGSSARTQVIP